MTQQEIASLTQEELRRAAHKKLDELNEELDVVVDYVAWNSKGASEAETQTCAILACSIMPRELLMVLLGLAIVRLARDEKAGAV